MANRKIGKEKREKIIAKFYGRCGYCGCIPKRFHIDHIDAFIFNQNNSIENLMPACAQCNNFKHCFTIEQFREELKKQVERARKLSVNFRMCEKFGLIQIRDIEIKFYFERVSEINNLSDEDFIKLFNKVARERD